jgi:hypothetical protein
MMQRSFVLCRACANFTGRRAGLERRESSDRLCAAGLQPADSPITCDSYLRASLAWKRGSDGWPSKRPPPSSSHT